MIETTQSPFLRRSQKTPIHISPYAKFGFKENPFPHNAAVIPYGDDPKTNGEIYVPALRSSEQQRFEKL